MFTAIIISVLAGIGIGAAGMWYLNKINAEEKAKALKADVEAKVESLVDSLKDIRDAKADELDIKLRSISDNVKGWFK